MNSQHTQPDTALFEGELRAILKRQYHAALAMLGEGIEKCPEELWFSRNYVNAFWQIAYHSLYFAHLYIGPDEESFRPLEGHQTDVQHPDGIPGPADPESTLPLLPDPYTKAQVLDYWKFCDTIVDDAVDALDLHRPDCGFHWYSVSKLEHQFVNIRHIQHGAAQLADRLRSEAGIGVSWAGSRSAGARKVVEGN